LGSDIHIYEDDIIETGRKEEGKREEGRGRKKKKKRITILNNIIHTEQQINRY
jgi:hypothetical protein